MGVAYITELFIAWYSGVEYEQYAFLNRATGPYAWAYWSMMTCNVFSPQFMWFKKLGPPIAKIYSTIVLNRQKPIFLCDPNHKGSECLALESLM